MGLLRRNIAKGMRFVSIMNAQFNIKKCISQSKKFGKGKQEWNKPCMDVRIHPKKLNTLVKIKLLFGFCNY